MQHWCYWCNHTLLILSQCYTACNSSQDYKKAQNYILLGITDYLVIHIATWKTKMPGTEGCLLFMIFGALFLGAESQPLNVTEQGECMVVLIYDTQESDIELYWNCYCRCLSLPLWSRQPLLRYLLFGRVRRLWLRYHHLWLLLLSI